MVFIVLTLVVPYYEEIVYRVCAFGFLCTIYKKNLIIPCVLTSLFFCFMHFQYYNALDQIVLFVVSVLLLMVRIKSQTPNAFIPNANAFRDECFCHSFKY
ncbi:CPBP family intramembrane metalloprotease [Klebsiella pneumoniae]|nr:CPBP family intramembrane glutamic endopeptidase [Klebsiella pneumoniae]MCH9374051.1 CPBP family intramembrane metalloprotease [Klebsiella pneumoniae]MCH9481179.1 CPBP family intramembrane metalloprotease [Klebsiella pneumoniae]